MTTATCLVRLCVAWLFFFFNTYLHTCQPGLLRRSRSHQSSTWTPTSVLHRHLHSQSNQSNQSNLMPNQHLLRTHSTFYNSRMCFQPSRPISAQRFAYEVLTTFTRTAILYARAGASCRVARSGGPTVPADCGPPGTRAHIEAVVCLDAHVWLRVWCVGVIFFATKHNAHMKQNRDARGMGADET